MYSIYSAAAWGAGGRIQLEFGYFYDANKAAKERTDTVIERKERGKVSIRKEKRSSSRDKL